MSSLGSREAVHATHVETQAVNGQQRQGIQNALQEAANELKKTHMNTVMKRIWTPKSFCRQGFVFVTGVCVKGPFVYAKCEIGPEVAGKPTFITVQAGCGCNGRYVHSMMIGHLESESQTKNKAPQHCITEFQKMLRLHVPNFLVGNHTPHVQASLIQLVQSMIKSCCSAKRCQRGRAQNC